MSDGYLRLFPTDPGWQPTPAAADAAVAYVAGLFSGPGDDVEQVDHEFYERVTLTDAGENTTRITCSRCEGDINPEWLYDLIEENGESFDNLDVTRAVSYPCGGLPAMGVLYDYLRAKDDAAAVKLMEDLDGGPAAVSGNGVAVDAIDLKGIEPAVTLGKLVSFVRGVEWQVDLVDLKLLWSGDEQDGPWLMSLDRAARDTLASINDAQLPELSARWGRIEELAWGGPLSDDQMLPVIKEVAALAQRARDAGEGLYCWCCL
ncbi:hypothetical protein ONA91_36870 [Micromonospora sp. DR5-3]|uniref:hypothetical protein n=1 Tax=unclassified Micromonospora TaxID=2617518 RepID=UPI0011D4440A|nr:MULTISPECIES: hypothetical protein [unclassified Micromonospora]MCW3820020.1 hypothetical protein [Micromonospora sp. DR5-3]TYC12620.1 hypothetical protein FXF52_40175 [Micromonospora sp. MP36]